MPCPIWQEVCGQSPWLRWGATCVSEWAREHAASASSLPALNGSTVGGKEFSQIFWRCFTSCVSAAFSPLYIIGAVMGNSFGLVHFNVLKNWLFCSCGGSCLWMFWFVFVKLCCCTVSQEEEEEMNGAGLGLEGVVAAMSYNSYVFFQHSNLFLSEFIPCDWDSSPPFSWVDLVHPCHVNQQSQCWAPIGQ